MALITPLFVVSILFFNSQEKMEARHSTGDRYQPGTCTKVDEEGEYQVAICEKVVIDGPCVDEVTCDGDLPIISPE